MLGEIDEGKGKVPPTSLTGLQLRASLRKITIIDAQNCWWNIPVVMIWRWTLPFYLCLVLVQLPKLLDDAKDLRWCSRLEEASLGEVDHRPRLIHIHLHSPVFFEIT